ncbi:MAG: ATP-binding protein, partial [Verrucomicrobiota bacterium]
MDHQTASPLPGYRLQKVQLMNWGTFDSTKGQIHTVRPEGRTSLLIGQNGSGKSTLVDSILTLLVRPGIRNYNVAAGSSGGKRERDERSYLLGAYGHASSDSENRASTLYLRKEGKSISVLLASFENQATGRSFTIAQVLHGTPESKVEKLYCFAKEEKDIASDFADIKSVDQISGKLESRGFRTTRTFLQYQKWIIAETHMRP